MRVGDVSKGAENMAIDSTTPRCTCKSGYKKNRRKFRGLPLIATKHNIPKKCVGPGKVPSCFFDLDCDDYSRSADSWCAEGTKGSGAANDPQ